MACSSSSLKARFCTVATLASIWAMLLAPIRAVVTTG